jgi:hypothetical protein
VKQVSREDADRQFEQGNRDAELDGEHAGDEDDGGENCCELNGIHVTSY